MRCSGTLIPVQASGEAYANTRFSFTQILEKVSVFLQNSALLLTNSEFQACPVKGANIDKIMRIVYTRNTIE